VDLAQHVSSGLGKFLCLRNTRKVGRPVDAEAW
jgi:hypothetical protein